MRGCSGRRRFAVRCSPNLLLIGVDLANHQALVLSGEQPRLFTTDDLVRLIEMQALES